MMPNPYLLPNPFFRLRLTPNIAQSITFEDILESVSANSEVHTQFSTNFADYVGARGAVGLGSGRACLRFGLESLEIENNFEVIIPTFVCGAVADAVISAGGTPVLCDVKSTDGTIDPSKIKSCISRKTKAIVAVHYQGLPCDIDEIQEIGMAHEIPVIEDCAHAVGSKFKNSPLGSSGSFAFYSFGVDKPMTTGNGGMITTNSISYLEKLSLKKYSLQAPSKTDEMHILKLLLEIDLLSNDRTYGLSSLTYFPAINYSLAVLRFKPKYEIGQISKIASKIGLLQLKGMERTIETRIRNSMALSEALVDCNKIQLIEYPDFKQPVFLRFTILTRSIGSRERLMRELKRSGIEAGPINWRLPLHALPYYSDICQRKISLEGADEFSSRFLNLPCHPYVSDTDIMKIKKCARAF